MTVLHLAQVNIARIRAPLEDPLMAGFVARLDEINALAERSPGFVWRLKGEANNATYLRPYEDERVIAYAALWWVPRGHEPGIDEAKKRLAHLDTHGPSPFAFTFKQPFPADADFARSTDWSSFKPCPAV